MTTIEQAQRKISQEPSLREMVKRRIESIEGSTEPQVLIIYSALVEVFSKALLANTGMWFLYVFPIAIVAFTFKQIVNQLKFILSVPEKDIDDVVPSDPLAAI
jgi:hypothetical protein